MLLLLALGCCFKSDLGKPLFSVKACFTCFDEEGTSYRDTFVLSDLPHSVIWDSVIYCLQKLISSNSVRMLN